MFNDIVTDKLSELMQINIYNIHWTLFSNAL